MTNEFEDLYNTDEFNDDDVLDSDESQEIKKTNEPEESLIDSGDKGQVYDFSKAPTSAKGPERINLDGKTVTITKTELRIPPLDSKWELSKNKKTEYKPCSFKVWYDNDGQGEYYSGIKVFKRDKGDVIKYSDPAIRNDGSSQITTLKRIYAEFKNKTIEEVSLHEFGAFLNSKPKAILKSKTFTWTDDDGKEQTTVKNMIERFI